MRLILRNFKQHENLDIDLPETGLVLLTGKSGIGKSTLFEAIDFALNDNGDDLVTWGKTSCSVRIEIPSLDLCIERFKKPNKLEVRLGSEKYVDDIAQEIIYKTLGVNAEEFSASAYIEQGQANSLLTLKPADQLRFIQKLADSSIDPDKFKHFVNNEISVIQKQQVQISNEMVLTIEKIHKTNQTINQTIITEPTKPEIELATVVSQHHDLTQVIHDSKTTLASKKNLLSQAILDQKNAQIKASLVDQIQELDNENQFAQEALQSLHGHHLILKTQIESFDISLYNKMLEIDKITQEAKELVKEINTLDPASLGSKSVTKFCEDKLLYIESELNALQESKTNNQKLKNDIIQMGTPIYCPVCESGLMLQKGKLHIHALTDQSSQLTTIEDELKDIDLKISECKTQLSTYQKYVALLNAKKQAIQKLNVPLESRIPADSCVKLINNYNELVQECNSVTQLIANETKKLSEIHTKKHKLQHQFNSLGEHKEIDINELSNEIEVIQNNLTKYNNDMHSLDVVKSQWSFYNQQYQQYQQNQNLIGSLSSDLSNLSKRLHELKELEASNTSKLSYYIRIMDITEKSALEAVQNVLDMINISTKKYIEAMFPDTGTSIEILNTSTTKKGDERAKISLHIIHNEQKIKNLKSFSGGQKSRLTLAFQLGLADLYQCPFLLVDEGFTGVDPETQHECLEFLKQFTGNKLILVIEHHAPESLFDEVINIQ